MATKRRGRPPKTEPTRKAVLSIRFTEEQFLAIERISRGGFMDPSQWARILILKTLVDAGLLAAPGES